MFLSTASMMFLSTAYLCLKGPSGLPSLLPTRECLDMAKQKNRRVRILCKGLEHFREALYSESVEDATSKKDESAPVAGPVAEVTAEESIVSADTTADQASSSSVKKPCTFYTADGGELFQTLFPAKKTPPNSPDSVASSSTAAEPSSRKVSPSGSDIKDFGYSSSDEHHVLDPTSFVEESTRKQLLKQLKKTAAIEEKTSRKVVKLAAENEALNAELTSANATARNRDAQTELAKTYANAMILSNIVLRQAVLDVGHQVIRDSDDPKGEALQEHLRIMDAVSVGAHSGMARLENHSAGQVQMDAVQNLGRDTTEEEQPKSSVEESEVSNTLQIQRRNTVANPKDSKSANRIVLNDHKQQRIKGKGRPAKETMDQGEANLEMIPADLQGKNLGVGKGQVVLHTTAITPRDPVPGNPEWSKSSGEDLVFGANRGSSHPSEVEDLPKSNGDDAATQKSTEDAIIPHNHVQGTDNSATYEFPETAGPATLWGILQSNYSVGEIGLGGDHDDDHNDAQGMDSIAECGISETYEFLEPAGPATMWGSLLSNQTVGVMGPGGNNDDDRNNVQGTNSNSKADVDTYEFPEAAGPATLWGILQSNQTSGETNTEGNQDETSATQEPISGANLGQDMDCGCEEGIGANYEFSEPAGPATMWGILQSNQTTEETGPDGDHTKDTAPHGPIADENELVKHVKPGENGCEGAVNQNYEFSESSGAATLWGILQSNQGEFSDKTGLATLCERPQSSPSEDLKDNSALTVGEPGLASDSSESPTNQEPGDQEPEIREPEFEELTTELVQEEDYTRSKVDAGEEAAPEKGGPAPQAKEFYFDWSDIDVSGAQGGPEQPQVVPEIETSISHEAGSTFTGNPLDDFGNDEKLAEQGAEIAVVLDIQEDLTVVQGQGDSGLIDISIDNALDNDSFDPLDDKNKDLLIVNDPEGEITTPAPYLDTSGRFNIRYGDDIGGETLQTSEHSDISTQPARTRSLPEPEVFEFPCAIPKPRSDAEVKAERKKAEHKRYKAKKKAEAAAKRGLKEEEEKEVPEEVEALEPPKTLAQSQAEEDMRLGDWRLKQQAKRQEQQDRAASLRGVVRSSRAHLIY